MENMYDINITIPNFFCKYSYSDTRSSYKSLVLTITIKTDQTQDIFNRKNISSVFENMKNKIIETSKFSIFESEFRMIRSIRHLCETQIDTEFSSNLKYDLHISLNIL